MHDLVRSEARGVHLAHWELRVGIRDPVRGRLAERVPAGGWLDPLSEAALAFLFRDDQLIRDGPRQIGRQRDAKPGTEGAVGGDAPGEIALHDDRDTGDQIALYLVGRGEQGGEVEAHARLDVLPHVDLSLQRLVEERHGGDQDGSPSCREHRCNGRLAGPTQTFEALEQRSVRHGRTPRPAP